MTKRAIFYTCFSRKKV